MCLANRAAEAPGAAADRAGPEPSRALHRPHAPEPRSMSIPRSSRRARNEKECAVYDWRKLLVTVRTTRCKYRGNAIRRGCRTHVADHFPCCGIS